MVGPGPYWSVERRGCNNKKHYCLSWDAFSSVLWLSSIHVCFPTYAPLVLIPSRYPSWFHMTLVSLPSQKHAQNIKKTQNYNWNAEKYELIWRYLHEVYPYTIFLKLKLWVAHHCFINNNVLLWTVSVSNSMTTVLLCNVNRYFVTSSFTQRNSFPGNQLFFLIFMRVI